MPSYARGYAAQSLGSNLMGIGRMIAGQRRDDEERERQRVLEERAVRAEERLARREQRDLVEFVDVRGGGMGPLPTFDYAE